MTSHSKTSVWKSVIVLTLLLPSLAFAEAKAYDTVYYSGKTQNISIRLAYADGYINASRIITTDATTKKKSTFLPDDKFDRADKLRFYHHTTSNKKFTDYFILEGIDEDSSPLPANIHGKYHFNGSAYDFVLKRE